MALQFRAAGTISTSTTSVAPTKPAGTLATDRMHLVLLWRSSAAAPAAPSGWVLEDESVTTVGAEAADTGSVGIAIYSADGSAAAPTISTSGRNGSAGWIETYYSDAGLPIVTASTDGHDSTINAAMAAIAAADPGGAVGDFLCMATGVNGDAAANTRTGLALTWPGCTVSAVRSRSTTSSTTGNDLRIYIDDVEVTAGSSTNKPELDWTWGTGVATSHPATATVYLRLREQSATPEIHTTTGDATGVRSTTAATTTRRTTTGQMVSVHSVEAIVVGAGEQHPTTGSATSTHSTTAVSLKRAITAANAAGVRSTTAVSSRRAITAANAAGVRSTTAVSTTRRTSSGAVTHRHDVSTLSSGLHGAVGGTAQVQHGVSAVTATMRTAESSTTPLIAGVSSDSSTTRITSGATLVILSATYIVGADLSLGLTDFEGTAVLTTDVPATAVPAVVPGTPATAALTARGPATATLAAVGPGQVVLAVTVPSEASVEPSVPADAILEPSAVSAATIHRE
jgi:hypothetical protein